MLRFFYHGTPDRLMHRDWSSSSWLFWKKTRQSMRFSQIRPDEEWSSMSFKAIDIPALGLEEFLHFLWSCLLQLLFRWLSNKHLLIIQQRAWFLSQRREVWAEDVMRAAHNAIQSERYDWAHGGCQHNTELFVLLGECCLRHVLASEQDVYEQNGSFRVASVK